MAMASMLTGQPSDAAHLSPHQKKALPNSQKCNGLPCMTSSGSMVA